ncbi:crossover junction endodeoxyribonuclease RuvC [Candidatus Saccharibacteria bacterium]|jgi:crossover junction endodeoxyribonuclease ruvC|nr:crossover junction endodeoxyribonuclease RuvC [Candidatus Saccharibacteria bacterium]QCT40147.1 crossover junction endodeoxyribonuclease RuvC [Candidatus Saccharibacteria bacterium oral taxon 955]QHU91572.1 crossover junction endodeoxyribonuclease RuvC [Candidatus Saccharibacteria bacterium oral taxon 955]QJU06149.1 crossover junction endodeoxyribonuclease RuvC [Candidatus Saccharibacteria bacterium oral taxon 955]QJU06966.1 crossover junction endodeoxyribonuclease RuvC [Candidatus Saccharib
MRIIGIDPGTGILGFGVIDVAHGKTTLVTAGVIRTPAHTPLPERLEEIYEGITDIIAETKPTVMAIEKLFFSRNITTAISVAQARGVAMLTGRQAKLRIEEYTPNEIKQAVAGYGAAKKAQVQEMVRIQLGLSEVPKPDDCADALAAAIMCAFALRGQ